LSSLRESAFSGSSAMRSTRADRSSLLTCVRVRSAQIGKASGVSRDDAALTIV
jgi:hypothetical protein